MRLNPRAYRDAPTEVGQWSLIKCLSLITSLIKRTKLGLIKGTAKEPLVSMIDHHSGHEAERLKDR
jgi:hypothetical protein